MVNVKMEMKGHMLMIEVDTREVNGLSKSGKSLVVASTHGNKDVPGKHGMKYSVNVYKLHQRTQTASDLME